MKTTKFFYLIMKGENLPIDEIEDKTDIIFTKRNIHLLDKIGISLKLSFC